MVSFRRPSNTEALICNGTQFLLSWSGQGRLIAIVKDHEL